MSMNIPDIIDRAFLVVAIAQRAAANGMAAAWDPDTGGGNTFESVRLSATGSEPATHLGASSGVTAGMRSGIEVAFGAVGWATIDKESDGETWETALADAGLQVIREV